jgi:hypothetical protein
MEKGPHKRQDPSSTSSIAPEVPIYGSRAEHRRAYLVAPPVVEPIHALVFATGRFVSCMTVWLFWTIISAAQGMDNVRTK